MGNALGISVLFFPVFDDFISCFNDANGRVLAMESSLAFTAFVSQRARIL